MLPSITADATTIEPSGFHAPVNLCDPEGMILTGGPPVTGTFTR